jgi:hypothetical protein
VRVLIFTGLFPNREQPLQGIPIFQRMAHFAERPGNQVQVIAPYPISRDGFAGRDGKGMGKYPERRKSGT